MSVIVVDPIDIVDVVPFLVAVVIPAVSVFPIVIYAISFVALVIFVADPVVVVVVPVVVLVGIPTVYVDPLVISGISDVDPDITSIN